MRPPPLLAAVLAVAPWLAGCGEGATPPLPPATDTARTAFEVAQGFHVPDPERIPSRLATNPGTPHGDYVGSLACNRCHEEEYRRWRGSFHSRTLYDAVDATIFGDFETPTVYDDGLTAFRVRPFVREDPATGRKRYFMEIRFRPVHEGGPMDVKEADTYGSGTLPDLEAHPVVEILYAFGNRRHQPYVARYPDGRYWVVPIYWNDVEREWMYDGFRAYTYSCANCHVTGIRSLAAPWHAGQQPLPMTHSVDGPRYLPPPDQEGWADGSVGCETCHGPGRAHVEAVEALGPEEYRRRLRSGEKQPTIYDGKRGTLEQRTDQCGQCHNFMTESTVTWVPKPHGFDRAPVREPIKPSPGNMGWQFYHDGSHMSPCTVVEVYRGSKMYREGVDCTECHDPHGTDHWADLKLPVHDNSLCISCHQDLAALEAQTAHSRHLAGSPGNRCVECHMPRHMVFTNGVQRMSDRIYSHEFSIPTGRRRVGGPPSACNICHTDRTHQWTQDTLALWARERAAREALVGPGPDADGPGR